jgi:hypothetical protein
MKVHVRHAVLEAGGDKRCNRRDDSEDSVGHGPRSQREPNAEAYERVTERTECDCLQKPEFRLRHGDVSASRPTAPPPKMYSFAASSGQP